MPLSSGTTQCQDSRLEPSSGLCKPLIHVHHGSSFLSTLNYVSKKLANKIWAVLKNLLLGRNVNALKCASRHLLENTIILNVEAEKIASFWYYYALIWLRRKNQWNERQEIEQVKFFYDIFQRPLKSKYYKERGEMILLDTLNFGSAFG